MLFPMYTVDADLVMQMTRVEPHEELKAAVVPGFGDCFALVVRSPK